MRYILPMILPSDPSTKHYTLHSPNFVISVSDKGRSTKERISKRTAWPLSRTLTEISITFFWKTDLYGSLKVVLRNKEQTSVLKINETGKMFLLLVKYWIDKTRIKSTSCHYQSPHGNHLWVLFQVSKLELRKIRFLMSYVHLIFSFT